MWSNRFLWTGLSSGVAVAALTLGGLWLALFVVSGITKDPTLTFPVDFALPGLIVYPTCWYMAIFRYRNYSLHRTMELVGATFGAVTAIVAAFMTIGGFYVVLTTFAAAQLWKVALLAASATFAYALMVAIGVIILIAPYAIVATPMALAHRWLLLKIFAPADPAPEPVK
jgi:hypothetical protein